MMIKNRTTLVLSLSFVLFAGVCLVVRTPVTAQDQAAESLSLKDLLEQRRDVLKSRAEAFASLAKIGQTTQEEVLSARMDLLDAELALASDKAQRMDVLQQKLACARDLESIMVQRKNSARGLVTDVLLATARRLDVEIEIQRERE